MTKNELPPTEWITNMANKKFTKQNARKYMRAIVEDSVSNGEVCLTNLAESACNHFDMKDEDGPLDQEDHWIWELAIEVSDWWNKQ